MQKDRTTMSTLSDSLRADTQLSLLNSNVTRLLSLNKVSITGGDFSEDYYKSLVDPLLSKSVLPLGELKDQLVAVEKKLLYTGLLQDIAVNVDLDPAKLAPVILKGDQQIEGPIPVEAKISLQSQPLFHFSSYSTTTDYDASASVQYLNPNFAKNASILLFNYNYTHDPIHHSSNKILDLALLKPLERFPATRAFFNPVISSIDAGHYASHGQYSIGAFLGLQSSLFHKAAVGIWTNGFSITNRRVNVANGASDVIRSDVGDDFKIGFQSNYKYDSRKLVQRFATDGVLLDFTNEFAGFNSLDQFSKASEDEKDLELNTFNKTVLKLNATKSLLKNIITTSVDFEVGTIFDKSKGTVHVFDRFTLGGSQSLRGFRPHSVGLKDSHDYIGGSSVFKANLSLFSRLPNVPSSIPLRLHSFINIGDNYNFGSFRDVTGLITSGDFITKSAAATGVGLVYRGDNASLDLSYNFPLSTRAQDSAKPGLNLSATVNFS